MFIGRENELADLNQLYTQDQFQLYVLYGRRRVGKTTLLNEFCKEKSHIFFSAEQSTDKRNLEKFSNIVFQFYGITTLEPFTSWENALLFIDEHQSGKRLILVFDEFPYLVKRNPSLLSVLQHLIDHQLKKGRLFLILCGSYMSFMEKEVLGSQSPIFGRRTAQLHLKPFSYRTSIRFLPDFSAEEKLMLYGAFGGTALYLQQSNNALSFEENIKQNFLRVTSYLYEEPVLLLHQELQEPGVYSSIIEAIACGATRINEISTKTGESSAKCLKYIHTLCELGILYKESPYGEKDSSRKTLYALSDFMFRFWYRYVFTNRTLLETGAQNAVWERRIAPDYNNYMGFVFEKICQDYLLYQNSLGNLPILFTSIGRWWGTNPVTRSQEEIDIIASDRNDYLICECKWRNEKTDLNVLRGLLEKADVFSKKRGETWFYLFSKSGFTNTVIEEASNDSHIVLVDLEDLLA